MRPGLSGWAQVCAPYASSIEDSDFKLSYDLYYLRHFSIWLDFSYPFQNDKDCLEGRWSLIFSFILSSYTKVNQYTNNNLSRTFLAPYFLVLILSSSSNLCFVFVLA